MVKRYCQGEWSQLAGKTGVGYGAGEPLREHQCTFGLTEWILWPKSPLLWRVLLKQKKRLSRVGTSIPKISMVIGTVNFEVDECIEY